MKKCSKCGETCEQGNWKGSGWIEIILWLCYIVPGLIYSIWRRQGFPTRCPSCKDESLIDYNPNSSDEDDRRVEIECEWCAEKILAKAKVCKHCGKSVVPALVHEEPIQNVEEVHKKELNDEKMPKNVKIFIGALIFFPMVWMTLDLSSNKVQEAATTTLEEKATPSRYTHEEICKAATAANYGREYKLMFAQKVRNKYHVTYTRQQDNTKWGVYCWIDGDGRILWQTDGTNNTGSNGKPGRVRNSEYDEVITYSEHYGLLHIHIEHADGSKTNKKFNIGEAQATN